MESHLFVYGTLMTSAAGARLGRAMRARLQREAQSLGPATAHGRLYDLGRYPGLVASPDADEIVHGEVFRLADPTRSFRWLDAYENVAADRPANEYERRAVPVRLAAGQSLDAWTYLYLGDAAQARYILDGRWQPP